MNLQYNPKNNPRVIVIQKLYGKYFKEDENLTFPKHRFKKFIKDVVNGTIERDEIITDELNTHLQGDLELSKLDKLEKLVLAGCESLTGTSHVWQHTSVFSGL